MFPFIVSMSNNKAVTTKGTNANSIHQEYFGNDTARFRLDKNSFFIVHCIIAAIFGLHMAMSQMGKPTDDSGVLAPGIFSINTNDIIETINVKIINLDIGFSANLKFILPIVKINYSTNFALFQWSFQPSLLERSDPYQINELFCSKSSFSISPDYSSL